MAATDKPFFVGELEKVSNVVNLLGLDLHTLSVKVSYNGRIWPVVSSSSQM